MRSFLLKRITCSSQQYYSSGRQKEIKCRHFLSCYCTYFDLNFKSPTKSEKYIYMEIVISNTPLSWIYVIQVCELKEFFSCQFSSLRCRWKHFSNLTINIHRLLQKWTKDLRLLWTQSFGTCFMQHHRNTSLKAGK